MKRHWVTTKMLYQEKVSSILSKANTDFKYLPKSEINQQSFRATGQTLLLPFAVFGYTYRSVATKFIC